LSNVFQFLLAAVFLVFLAGVALFLPVPDDDKTSRKFLKIVSLFAYLVVIFVFRDLLPDFLINLYLDFVSIPSQLIFEFKLYSTGAEIIIYLFLMLISAYFSVFLARKALFLPVKNSKNKNHTIIIKILSLFAFTMAIMYSFLMFFHFVFAV
jgi:hypothetical protein